MSDEKFISIVLADDHPIVRRGIRHLLTAQTDFVVLADAADGLEAVDFITKLQPDVALLDLMMPGLGGFEVMRVLREQSPTTQVIVLSMHNNSAFIGEAFKAGAAGYVLKGCGEEDIVRAVREVAAGRRFLSPPVSEVVVNNYIAQTQTAPLDPHETLTPRERQILQQMAEGKTNLEIAARFKISPRTVEFHRAKVLRKLGLQTQTELVLHAVRHGMICAD